MNRKVVFWCTFLAVILLAAICLVFARLFSDEILTAGKEDADSRTEVLCAVPSDAVAIYEVNSISDAEGVFSLFASDFHDLVTRFPSDAGALKTALSLHYTGKNKISMLAVCTIPQTVDKDAFLKNILDRCAGVIEKRYDQHTIYRSSVPDINFSVKGNYLLMSGSVILIESSLRHLETHQSLLDNPIFSEAVSGMGAGNVLYLNNGNVGKLYSGMAMPYYRKYASFTSHVADWTAISVDIHDGCMSGSGRFFHKDPAVSYSTALSAQEGGRSDLYDMVPYDAVSLLTLKISDMDKFLSDYGFFYSSWKKKKRNTDSGRRLAGSAGLSEIARVTVRTDEGHKPVIMLRVDDSGALCGSGEEIDSCGFAGMASSLAGDIFSLPDTSFCFAADRHWVAVSDLKTLESYKEKVRSIHFTPFSEWISQTPATRHSDRNSVLSFMVNLSSMEDSLSVFLKEQFSGPVSSILKDHNFNFLSFSLKADAGDVVPEYAIFSGNLEKMPVLRHSGSLVDGSSGSAAPSIDVPGGPYEVKDFRTGKQNTLTRTEKGHLQYKDHNGKVLWTVPFGGEICGFVPQIDYLKNNKLQMLFASGSTLYLMTRLGGWVKPYPVDTGKDIVLGPAVFDFSGDKEYCIMLLHSDNTVAMYDRDGKKMSGWNDITMPEPICALPEPLKVGNHNLWVVRSTGQTVIFTSEGLPAADFTRKRRLAPDTGIEVLSSDEVKVTSADGRVMKLNIETGEISKYR